MDSNGSMFRNLVLISQVSISLMVPIFLCLALGLWIDEKFGTWFSIPMLVLGIAAGGRNAYVLLMNVVRTEEKKRIAKQEQEIKEKVERANRTKSNDKEDKTVK